MTLISIKYQYRSATGSTRGNIVTFDEHYGYDIRSSYRFGMQTETGLLRGIAAYNYLTQPLNELGETFLDMIPDYVVPVTLVPNPDYVYGMGDKYKTMPNPNYETELMACNLQVDTFRFILTNFLTLICKVSFPKVPDTGIDLQWWKYDVDHWDAIEVVSGLYPGGSRWVTVEDTDRERKVEMFVNYSKARTGTKDAFLRLLLGLQ